MTARDDRPGYLAIVEWDDIVSHAGWCDEWEPDIEPARCIDVGWVIERDGYIVLVRSLHPAESASGDAAALPRGCVRDIRRVAED